MTKEQDLEVYEKQGLGARMGFGKNPALIIVDFINGFNDPDAFVQAIKEELEFSDVKYDMTFWENYVDEIMQLTTPEVSMFRYGGLV